MPNAMRSGISLVTGLVLVMGLARTAAAQDKKVDFSAGYQHLSAKQKGDEGWTKLPSGWYADVAGNVVPKLGIVVQVAGNYKDLDGVPTAVHQGMLGVRYKAMASHSRTVFGQFLVGITRVGVDRGSSFTPPQFSKTSESDFSYQVGTGVNLKPGAVGVRIGVDYVRLKGKDGGSVLGGESTNMIRFTVGLAL